MLNKIIDFSLRNKLIIILFTLTVALFGIYSILKIPVGAVPDITNNQVQVITTSGNLSTQEIEQFITAPVELEMANLPGVEEIRSVSKFGLSVVTIVFKDNLGTYLPRQLIAEKIKSASANIPEGFGTPEMGPITTGLGEIYQYILDVKPGYENQYSAMDLRTIQDWIVRRQLSGINGVVEVNSWGGFLKQYEIAVDPARLIGLNLTLLEVFTALENNNSISGGAYIEKTNQSYFIRGDGQVKSLQDIEQIVVANREGLPILVRDIATVHFGYANRYGAITANGQGEKVLGQIMMLKDANSKDVIRQVHERVEMVQKNLPEGVYINPILDRSDLISKTSLTVVENIVLGCIIVVLVVILLLGNVRSALVIASMIPLALLFTLSLMYIFGIDANLMSLGALDFGIIIDGAVIIVEFIAIKISLKQNELEGLEPTERKYLIDRITFDGASKMMNSAIFGQVIILIVFIPILSLSNVEGKMFRPMALSFSFAILGAMVLGLTWLPVASSLFLKPEGSRDNKISHWIMKLAYRSYTPIIKWACGHKRIVLGLALVALLLTGFLFSRMGGEFVPTLDEGDFVIQPVLKTGTSLTKTVELTTRMENILLDKFSEVDQIVCRIGAAEVPTDPMSMEEIDMIIKLHPRSEWKVTKSKEELADKFKEALSVIPGIEYEFTQPIEMRFNELITGVRADIAVKLFGEDLEYLNKKAFEIRELIADVPGAADVIIEKTAGLPQMSVEYNRSKVAYYGLNIQTLNKYLAVAFGGDITGSVFEGEKRFDMAVRLQKQNRVNLSDIKNLQVPLPNGNQVPLKELANITITEGPAKISRDNTQRRVVVSVNVRNRDLESVVEDIQVILDNNLTLKPGYQLAYGGQFENLQNATKRLMYAVPLALLLIFIFLHFAFKSFKDAVMIFSAVPLATVGGVLLLWMRGMPFSVSAGIGFIALFGIAVLNGIVLIEHLKELQEKGNLSMREIIIQGTTNRLRPVMLTAAAAAMGFLPMAVSTGAGAEVQRPLATVVIGGLITSTLLTMIALPLLFEIFNNVTGIQLFPLRFIRSKKVLISILLLGFMSYIKAQEREISLQEAIDITLTNNKKLQAYGLKVDQKEALRGTAFSIDKTQLYYEYDENNVAENGYPLSVFGVAQNFEFPTVYFKQRKINDQYMQMASADYYRQQQQLVKEVSQAYYEVLYILNKQQIYERIDSLYSRFQKGVEISFKHGDVSNLDVLNAKAKRQQLKMEINRIGYGLQSAEEKLQTIMQYDSAYAVSMQELPKVSLVNEGLEMNSGLKMLQLEGEIENSTLKLERNKLLPDLSVGYFIGSNSYAHAQNYQGIQLGIAVPLFFGEQNAKIQASKIGLDMNRKMLDHYRINLNALYRSYKMELMKYEESIQFYESTGKQLSEEIIRTTEKSYELGDINFYEFVLSIENALQFTLDYLESVSEYNRLALEMNYLMH